MRAKILSTTTSKEIEMPSCFSRAIREDIAQKAFEVSKSIQPYAPFKEAGKQHSASGVITHGRRLWKTAYGHGMSRIPRKALWRRGDQFYWVGAEVNMGRGGRRAHPPKLAHFQKKLKTNAKEKKIALASGLTATTEIKFLKRRYSSLADKKLEVSLPLVIDSTVLKLKTKEFFKFLKEHTKDLYPLALKEKKQRAGIGKLRGRRYRSNAGMLLVTGSKENAKYQGIETTKANELSILQLWPLGRLALFTEQAVKEIGEKLK